MSKYPRAKRADDAGKELAEEVYRLAKKNGYHDSVIAFAASYLLINSVAGISDSVEDMKEGLRRFHLDMLDGAAGTFLARQKSVGSA